MTTTELRERVEEFLITDRSLEARALIHRTTSAGVDVPDEIWMKVEERLAHIESREAYAEFYTSHRPSFVKADVIHKIHTTIPRLATVRRVMEKQRPKSILELGCLDGFALNHLCQELKATGFGVDLDPEAIAHGREVTKSLKIAVEFEQGFIEDLDLGTTFDAILIAEVLEHVIDPEEVLAVAEKHLAPGGMIYLTCPASPVPHFGNEHEEKEHLRCFSPEDFKELIGDRAIELHEVRDTGQHKEQVLIYRRPRVAFVMNHVKGGWSPGDPKSYGGSEEGVVELTKALKERGYEVEVFMNLDGVDDEESEPLSYQTSLVPFVKFRRMDEWDPTEERDIVIVVKDPQVLDGTINARKVLLWTADAHGPNELTQGRLSKLDKIIAISEFHRQEILDLNGHLSDERVIQIPFSAQGSMFNDMGVLRAEHGMLYSSSFDRGLETLLDAWPDIRSAVPDATLEIGYGWELSDKVAGGSPGYESFKARLTEKMDQDGITLLPRGPIADSRPFLRASILAYPCNGGERFCITGLKAQILGAIPVVIPTMALDETIRHGVKATPETYVDELISLLRDLPRQEKIRSEMLQDNHLRRMWPELVGDEWTPLWKEALQENQKVKPKGDLPGPQGKRVHPMDIFMLVPGMPFEGDLLDSGKSLGGSETAGLCMARELAVLGHRVALYGSGKPGTYDGVEYRPKGQWQEDAERIPHDVSIVQRVPEAFVPRLAAKLRILWVHDLAQGRNEGNFKGVLWNVDSVFTVSEMHARQYLKAMTLPPEKDLFFSTRNGIDIDRIQKGAPTGRDMKTLVYTSRPERGLDVLLEKVFPALLKKDKSYRLKITGYANDVEEMREFYGHLRAKAGEYGDAVEWLDPLSKADLYKLYRSAGAYVYPTPGWSSPEFREVSCITAMECMAAGLPFVSTAWGALPETLAEGAGVLVDPGKEIGDDDYVDRFVGAILRATGDEWEAMSKAGKKAAKKLSWGAVAKTWGKEFSRLLAWKTDDPVRTARHCLRRSDILAAQAAVEGLDSPEALEVQGYIRDYWGRALGGKGHRKEHREEIGAKRTDEGFDAAITDPRLGRIVAWVTKRPKVKRILMPGCADGVLALHLSNQRPDVQVVGVEVDAASVDFARGLLGDPEKAKTPDSVRFFTESAFFDQDKVEEFDLVLFLGSVEREKEPWTYIDRFEKYGAKDCHVLILSSYGPWEFSSYLTNPLREQLWNFSGQDLADLFKGKRDLMTQPIPHGMQMEMKEPLGWWAITYDLNGIACGEIDMERKLDLMAPPSTVSALILAGGAKAHENLHWALGSIHGWVDEVIIGTGGNMTDETRHIAEMHDGYLHKVRIVDTESPVDPKFGFEGPRNEMLNHARMNMILWFDSDEKVIGGPDLWKFRDPRSYYDGQAIRQHHFAVDAKFEPDIPARLFRRVHRDGRQPRWYGMIHEHPETALNEGPGMIAPVPDVHIPHVGYLREDVRRERFSRNLPLLQADMIRYPNRLLQQHFRMRDGMLTVRNLLERTGGRGTPEVKAICREVISIWREHFRGKSHYLSTDSMDHMSAACKILGSGFEILMHFSTNRFDAPGAVNVLQRGELTATAPKLCRFETIEDMKSELMARMVGAVEPFMREDF